MAGIHNVFLF